MGSKQVLQRVIVVLDEPQDPVNIGMVVRTMKNMGLSRLRLVNPGGFDPHRILGVAHTGADLVDAAELSERLDDAVAGVRLVVGTTGRGRRVRRNYVRPRDAAAEILEVAGSGGEVALIYGREDRGLSNEQLDLCNRLLVIPTDSDHPSLNLAQAVLVVAYEIFLAAEAAPPFKAPRRAAARADRDELESLFSEAEASLHAIDFFKAQKVKPLMRTVREVAARADLDERETALFKAMAYEVRNFLARHGIDAGG
ncbi:MAG: TrmJ/YjtD family RNA methyltransferase [Gemmatimonadota bacterium]|nr:MAG: TrmJ/YjtD family RNA methyltransferase [Gemmatimonadota bacterium]